ncbi:MAG: hypothetical protein KAQ99_10475 [Candidatus Aureabacteria bacterium]|nr:hypothetical protein [Candidatus Auribacterota bacterium]MCK5161988.1 hypothetical protein [Candidatus Auribacterota bacterium]
MKIAKVLFLISTILIFSRPIFAEEPKEYSPYPIIFVHGYNAKEPSSWDAWSTAKSSIQIYFKSDGEHKYPSLDEREKYFPLVNYGIRKTGPISRNGNIPDIARQVLLPKVEWALDNCFPIDYPESERKVIIVAHSMGGLVTRSFLTQFDSYQNKIYRVVFIDTPHLGSPYASAVWMIDKEAKEKLPPLIDENATFFSKSVGALKFLSPVAGKTAEIIFSHVSWNLQERLNRDRACLWIVENFIGTDPDGYAIDKMRLPFHSEYHDIITGRYGLGYKSVPIDIIYDGDETFLGTANLAIPSNFKIIRGDGSLTFLGIPLVNTATGLLFRYREGSPLGFSFEPDYTLEDTKTTGDDIVSKLSQEKLTKAAEPRTDYKINVWHGAATEAWWTILQAIEDKPEIENIKAVEVDETDEAGEKEYYIKIKVKDYLLADIEIEEMTLDNEDVIPADFYGADSKDKPYHAFGKEFLKEREDEEAVVTDESGNTHPLKLFPGEFYVKVTMNPNEEHTFYIKIKNPAEEFVQDDSFTAEETAIVPETMIFYAICAIGDPSYPGSGRLQHCDNDYDINVPWTVAREAATATFTNYTIRIGASQQTSSSPGTIYYQSCINRANLNFDTSALPDTADITGVTLNLYGRFLYGSVSIGITQSSQTDPEYLVAADYNNITLNSPPEGATRKAAVLGDMTITLNSTGRGWISKTGWTKICLRCSHDIDNSPPGYDNSNRITFRTSTIYYTLRPFLTITYTEEEEE